MKKEVYDYIKKSKKVTCSEVSNALNLNGCEALNIIEDLRVDGYLKACTPVPLDVTNSNSCYYSVTGKVYEEAFLEDIK